MGEIIGQTYREGGFGNTPLDQNSDTYQTQVEYGVAFAKMAAVMCVGIMGGDVETAAFTAENAARYNSMLLPLLEVAGVAMSAQEIYEAYQEEGEEGARKQAAIETAIHLTVGSKTKPLMKLCELFNTPLPDPVLEYITPINEVLGRGVDCYRRGVQVCNAERERSRDGNLSLGLGPLPTAVGGKFTIAVMDEFKVPTSCGGTLLTVAPMGGYVKTAGKVALNTVKGSLKSVTSLVSKELAALRGAGTNASRSLSLQGARKLNDKMGTSVLQSSPGYPASSVKQAQMLRNSLISEELGAGHAFEKHIVQQGEFPGWIRTRSQFTQHIEQVLNDPLTHSKVLSNNKTAYWHSPTATVVIRNPNAIDGGTVFQPLNGINYFRELR